MPVNGQFRIRTGSGAFVISGDVSIEGTAGELIDIRVTKSTDDGATFPTQISHIRRPILSLPGPRDIAFFPIKFTPILNEGDRIRIEVENNTSTNNVTMELDSSITINRI